ncbi:MAG: CPBP family intramembrane metalloprotease [Prevotellaceae bacterium]|nr:CPBP family intramembrane metalloprotease [Candidatus Minthosoma caballi]
MKKVLYPVLAICIFLIMQTVVSVAIMVPTIINMLVNNEHITDPSSIMAAIPMELMAGAIGVAGALTIIVISLFKMINWKKVLNFNDINWGKAIIYILAAAFGIFACDIIEEIIDLPNLIEVEMTGMANTAIGMLSIGVIGPICEEFIFREAVLGYMLRNKVNTWAAIIGSAIAFGLIHANPAQIPFAAVMGVVLGYIYHKTGNIIVPCIIHIINNSAAVYMMNVLGDKADEVSITESLGGTPIALLTSAIGIALCIGIFYITDKKKARYELQG